MGDPFPSRLGVALAEKVDALCFWSDVGPIYWTVKHFTEALRGASCYLRDMSAYSLISLPLTLLLFACFACHCFFQRGLQNVQLQLQTLLLSPVLCSRPVSGLHFRPYNFPAACICGTFWGEFLSVLPGLFLVVSAVATVAGICSPVTHVLSFVALCDLPLHADRNRSSVGRPHAVCVTMW